MDSSIVPDSSIFGDIHCDGMEVEEDIRLELVGTDLSPRSVNEICLICAAEVGGKEDVFEEGKTESFFGQMGQRQREEYLRTTCEVLQLRNTQNILENSQEQVMSDEVKFCTDCLGNLNHFRSVQNQLSALKLQLQELIDMVSKSFTHASERIALTSGVDTHPSLRTNIMTELSSDVKQEVITADSYRHAQPMSMVSAILPDTNQYDDDNSADETMFGEDGSYDWNPPTKMRSQRVMGSLSFVDTKPCEVRITRLDGGDDRPRKSQKESLKVKSEFAENTRNDLRPNASRKRIREMKRKWKAVTKTESFEFPSALPCPSRHRRKKSEPCPMTDCNQRFISVTHVGYHIRQIHEGLEKPFNCIACEDTEFEDYADLRKHIRNEHDPKRNPRISTITCPKCSRGFPGYNELIMHFRRQGGMCLKDPLPLNSTVDRTSKEPKKFTCGACAKQFRTRYLLNIHVKANHMGVHPFLCEICCKPFKRELSLKVHQRRLHPKEYMEAFNIDEQDFLDNLKNRHCEICNKTFVNQQGKKNHDVIHTQQYNYRCSKCGIGCTSKRNLAFHEVTHSDVKDFACPECSIRFNRVDKLRRHLKTVHATDGRKREYSCDFCHKSFWDNFALQRHKRIMHREALPQEEAPQFECALCGYTCPDKGYLGIHFKTKKHKEKVALAQGQLEIKEQEIINTRSILDSLPPVSFV